MSFSSWQYKTFLVSDIANEKRPLRQSRIFMEVPPKSIPNVIASRKAARRSRFSGFTPKGHEGKGGISRLRRSWLLAMTGYAKVSNEKIEACHK